MNDIRVRKFTMDIAGGGRFPSCRARARRPRLLRLRRGKLSSLKRPFTADLHTLSKCLAPAQSSRAVFKPLYYHYP